MFTESQIQEISQKLALYAVKDTMLDSATLPLTGEELIAIIQNGENKLATVGLLKNDDNYDFLFYEELTLAEYDAKTSYNSHCMYIIKDADNNTVKIYIGTYSIWTLDMTPFVIQKYDSQDDRVILQKAANNKDYLIGLNLNANNGDTGLVFAVEDSTDDYIEVSNTGEINIRTSTGTSTQSLSEHYFKNYRKQLLQEGLLFYVALAKQNTASFEIALKYGLNTSDKKVYQYDEDNEQWVAIEKCVPNKLYITNDYEYFLIDNEWKAIPFGLTRDELTLGKLNVLGEYQGTLDGDHANDVFYLNEWYDPKSTTDTNVKIHAEDINAKRRAISGFSHAYATGDKSSALKDAYLCNGVEYNALQSHLIDISKFVKHINDNSIVTDMKYAVNNFIPLNYIQLTSHVKHFVCEFEITSLNDTIYHGDFNYYYFKFRLTYSNENCSHETTDMKIKLECLDYYLSKNNAYYLSNTLGFNLDNIKVGYEVSYNSKVSDYIISLYVLKKIIKAWTASETITEPIMVFNLLSTSYTNNSLVLDAIKDDTNKGINPVVYYYVFNYKNTDYTTFYEWVLGVHKHPSENNNDTEVLDTLAYYDGSILYSPKGAVLNLAECGNANYIGAIKEVKGSDDINVVTVGNLATVSFAGGSGSGGRLILEINDNNYTDYIKEYGTYYYLFLDKQYSLIFFECSALYTNSISICGICPAGVNPIGVITDASKLQKFDNGYEVTMINSLERSGTQLYTFAYPAFRTKQREDNSFPYDYTFYCRTTAQTDTQPVWQTDIITLSNLEYFNTRLTKFLCYKKRWYSLMY